MLTRKQEIEMYAEVHHRPIEYAEQVANYAAERGLVFRDWEADWDSPIGFTRK